MNDKKVQILVLILFYSCSMCAQFTGGEHDGYDKTKLINAINIYAGGSQDGHYSAIFSNPINIYAGGNKDGYNHQNYENTINIFAGGSKDGYSSKAKVVTFIWTGLVGTGWNVSGNWLDGIIPNINNSVIIPTEAVNFPAINAGIFSIGEDPNNGAFLCKKINIEGGASLTLRVNAFLENYGVMEIQGSVDVLNSSANAVQNLNGGLISIKSGGTFNLIPN